MEQSSSRDWEGAGSSSMFLSSSRSSRYLGNSSNEVCYWYSSSDEQRVFLSSTTSIFLMIYSNMGSYFVQTGFLKEIPFNCFYEKRVSLCIFFVILCLCWLLFFFFFFIYCIFYFQLFLKNI